jgi:inner membrane protein
MDTGSHGLAGAMLDRTLTERPGGRAALWIGFLAAMIPDLDFYFLSDRLDYLRNHRGWSHSFVFLPVFALAIAYVAKLFFRRARLRDLWVFAAVGIFSHILFDWMTSFGTMFLTPFSRTRFSLDWVFIVDPFFTGISLVTVAVAIFAPSRGRRAARVGAALLFAYIFFCGAVHARALAAWKRIDRVPPGAPVAVMPQLLSPFRWLGLTDHGGELHACFFDVGPFARAVPEPRVPEKLWDAIRMLPKFYPPPERARIKTFRKPPESTLYAKAR